MDQQLYMVLLNKVINWNPGIERDRKQQEK